MKSCPSIERPLWIELAAARLSMLSTDQIAARVDQSFRLLTGANRTAVRRQQTIRATIGWSYQLLSEPERGERSEMTNSPSTHTRAITK